MYSQQDLQDAINTALHNKFLQVFSRQNIMNRAVRSVLADMDLKGTKRSAHLSPPLFEDNFNYAAPSDLKKIIDIRKQINRPLYEKWTLKDETDFDQLKGRGIPLVAVANASFARMLKIDGLTGFKKVILHDMDTLNGWGDVAGTDAENLSVDTLNFVQGRGAIRFDTASGGATAAIEISNMTPKDLSDDFDRESSIFVWVYVPDAITLSNLTNFILRWGNDASNYWARTVEVNNEGLGFHHGWNLLRFDWKDATQTGTVDLADIKYLRLTITKDVGQAALTGWRADDIVIRKGEIYNVVYYSKFGWQTSGGTYIENSTAAGDLLNADTEEFDLFVTKGAEFGAQALKEKDDIIYYRQEYERLKLAYSHPSEALTIINSWI